MHENRVLVEDGSKIEMYTSIKHFSTSSLFQKRQLRGSVCRLRTRSLRFQLQLIDLHRWEIFSKAPPPPPRKIMFMSMVEIYYLVCNSRSSNFHASAHAAIVYVHVRAQQKQTAFNTLLCPLSILGRKFQQHLNFIASSLSLSHSLILHRGTPCREMGSLRKARSKTKRK